MVSKKKGQGNWQKYFVNWGLGFGLTILAFLWLTLIAAAWVKAAEPSSDERVAEQAGEQAGEQADQKPINQVTENRRPADQGSSDQSDDEYNFNWLDPDKKIYVLQNRRYLKSGHVILSGMGGVGFSNPYLSTYNLDGRVDYYISETWGFELFYTYTNNVANSTYQALLNAAANTLPSIRENRGQYGGMVQFVPWYAKINVFNAILYFDWYFGAGVGTIQSFVDTRQTSQALSNFTEDDKTALFFNTGHLYHLSEHWLVRLDLTGAFYQAPVNGLSGASSWFSNLNFGAGIGWKP